MSSRRGQIEALGIIIAVVALAVLFVVYLAITDPSGDFKRILGIPTEPACTPSDEVCDGVDNNCNNYIDEGMLCNEGETCFAGKCIQK